MKKLPAAVSLGKRGGKRQKEIYDSKQMSEWGKMGGRPHKIKEKRPVHKPLAESRR